MKPRLLIEPEGLARELETRGPGLRVFDCRYRLDDHGAGRRLWSAEHLPGAFPADLGKHLSGPTTSESGRHPLPEPRVFVDWCRAHGIDGDSTVVCYDDVGGMFAARLWWMLARWLQHPDVRILDGGITLWRREGRPLTAAVPATPEASAWAPEVDLAAVVSAPDLTDYRVVDARAGERFRGEQEAIDPVAGHVPGARNRPASANLAGDGRLRPGSELRADWDHLLAGHESTRVAQMCGSGVMACHNILSMELAGLPGSRLYAGSWSEWIRNPARPVATGPEVERPDGSG